MEQTAIQLKEFKPALAGYIRGSLDLLGRSLVPDDDAIHDIRVLMKRFRATIRLLKPILDDETYRREYLAGREVGRILCSWRETSVLRKTVKSLKKENPGLFIKLRDNEKIQELLRKPYSSWEMVAEKSESIKTIGTQLTKAQYRIRFISLRSPDTQLLIDELERNYLIASAAYLDCRNNPKQELLHEFRKKSKTFLYQLYFFRPLDAPAIKSLEKKLDSLTQDLGKCNDLAQIMTELGYKYKSDNSPAMDELAVVIRDWQDKYLLKVWGTAYRIFCPGQSMRELSAFKTAATRSKAV